jgi:excisionase family DNA binding protein
MSLFGNRNEIYKMAELHMSSVRKERADSQGARAQ